MYIKGLRAFSASIVWVWVPRGTRSRPREEGGEGRGRERDGIWIGSPQNTYDLADHVGGCGDVDCRFESWHLAKGFPQLGNIKEREKMSVVSMNCRWEHNSRDIYIYIAS